MDNGGERIVVTQAMVDELAQQHQARWMRAATEQELASLVDAHVRDEVMYREGLTLGLDRDDPVIKRRVRQKLDVMFEEQLAAAAPQRRRAVGAPGPTRGSLHKAGQPELRADLLRRLGQGARGRTRRCRCPGRAGARCRCTGVGPAHAAAAQRGVATGGPRQARFRRGIHASA